MASKDIDDALAAYPQLHKLYEYWHSKSGPGRLPARADFDPTELPGSVWEHLMLLDLVREGGTLHIRLRLTGSHIDRALGHNATGEFMEEALTGDPAYRAYIQALYEELASCGEPIFSRNVFRLSGQSATMLTTRLSLPLADDHRTVNMALVGVVFEYPREFEPHYGSALQGFTEILRQRLPR
jgi:hypothetical protein